MSCILQSSMSFDFSPLEFWGTFQLTVCLRSRPRVTANAFLPPRIPAPKPWQRVAVDPAAGHRQRKIWKRVPGSSGSNPARDAYLRDMAELEDARGQNPRKRVRGSAHVPVYGEGLTLSTAFVNKVNEEAKNLETSFTTKDATFPDNQLSWVPRKRHNSRWPIPPNMDRTTDFEIPSAPQAAEPTIQIDDKASLNRSTRRLSRRFTLLPDGDESPRKLLMPRLSPTKKPVSALSPVKKVPAITMLSPIKVSDSPLRAFRIHATPTKVVLESPKMSPPEKSPSKPSPATSTPGAMLPPATTTPRAIASQLQHTDSPVPLIFDQPTSDSVAEPQHEARRRISLAAARRTERKSLGISRLDAVRNSPNRRHSFNNLDALIAEGMDSGKGRRSTLGGGFLSSKEDVIEIDAKTNLDIFGQPSKAVASTPRRFAFGVDKLDETPQPSAPLDGFFSPLMTDISGMTESAPAKDASPQQQPEQAAASPAPCATDAGDEPSVLEDSTPLPASIEESPVEEHQPAEVEKSPAPEEQPTEVEEVSALVEEEQVAEIEESPVYEHQAAEGDISFTPYEPEGLSTIYEESTIIESPRKSPRKSPVKAVSAVEVQDTSMVIEEHEAISFIEPGVVLKATEESSIEKNDMPAAPSTPRSTRVAPGSPSTPLQNHDLDAVLQLSIKRSIKRSARKDEVPRFNQLDGSPSIPGAHEDSFASMDDTCELSDLSICSVDISTEHLVTTTTTSPPIASPQQQPTDSPVASPSQPETEANAKDEEVSLPETAPFPVALSFESDADTVVDPVAEDTVDEKEPVEVEKTSSPTPECDAPLSRQVAEDEAIVSQAKVLAPGTPPQATPIAQSEETGKVSTPEQRTEDNVDASEASGFTPIHGRQSSPTELVQPAVTTLADELEAESDDLDEDEVVEQDVVDEACDELTMAVDDDFTSVPPPQPENDTIQLQARHDDSEAELLRKFVTRVTADKNAKAAAAAAAAASIAQNSRLKRRSGSMSTITSSTGSPMLNAEADAPADRKPLGEKSPNSPSPVKKRKLEDLKDSQAKDMVVPQDAPDSPSQAPPPKRRRKRVLGSSENTLDRSTPVAPPPPDDEAPRRSTRARSTRTLRPTAPSANSIALSLIPVRLPGMGAMDDSTMDTTLNMARQRNEEKDLATMTRVNTRKNKGQAVHPAVILARHAEDSSWKVNEAKAEPKEPRTNPDRTVKNVRWAEELASYQGESPVLPAADANDVKDVPVVKTTTTTNFMMSRAMEDDDDMDELAIPTITEVPLPPTVSKAASVAENKPEPPKTRTRKVVAATASTSTAAVPKAAAPKAAAPKSVATKVDAPKTAAAKAAAPVAAASTRRSTRSTRLQTPTPMKKVVSAESTTAPKRAIPSRAKTALPKPAASTAATKATAAAPAEPATASASGIKKAAGRPTRRTDVAKLGMTTVNGTPAPKRRGRPAASSS
ncbi:uncharacterized protein PODANS_5_10040 [Podospora anserina S mat+]|uniref:Podospora anserina S mat+ genomic DNA chromosome 5, supercontig 9 n=1 Tax=Podospora anserina (strain S / ATCC MYA-4624 / DSM 980 / FGSC 10383) TaxID=515849 RepID=B2ALA1_PODAN|nr:uncharacterized protein PODANS_5_10040 [Podospora anserina S mat+]CAP64739.1 unnamed protein product [Podospora anserina S mat+]CDP30138.1 Putative protein of unknown function [Podospora anserina S mat+]